MAEQIRAAGVSAEDLVAAIRVHLDRVHDAVRRVGADPGTAVEVVQNSALDLVEDGPAVLGFAIMILNYAVH